MRTERARFRWNTGPRPYPSNDARPTTRPRRQQLRLIVRRQPSGPAHQVFTALRPLTRSAHYDARANQRIGSSRSTCRHRRQGIRTYAPSGLAAREGYPRRGLLAVFDESGTCCRRSSAATRRPWGVRLALPVSASSAATCWSAIFSFVEADNAFDREPGRSGHHPRSTRQQQYPVAFGRSIRDRG